MFGVLVASWVISRTSVMQNKGKELEEAEGMAVRAGGRGGPLRLPWR